MKTKLIFEPLKDIVAVEGGIRIVPGSFQIVWLSLNEDELIIRLQELPARIDLSTNTEGSKTLWLLDDTENEKYLEPYRQNPLCESETIWRNSANPPPFWNYPGSALCENRMSCGVENIHGGCYHYLWHEPDKCDNERHCFVAEKKVKCLQEKSMTRVL